MLSRRGFLKVASVAASVAVPYGLLRWADSSPQSNSLTVYTWETYDLQPWVDEWTEKSGIPVNVVLTGSADEMFAKMTSGAINPDIIVLDTGSLRRYVRIRLITPIDVSKIKNAALIGPGLDFVRRNSFGGQVYGIPYNWGVEPLMYERSIGDLDSWSQLWEPRFRGRVSLFDDGYATIPMIAIKIGARDPYNLTEAEFKRVAEALRELRPQVVQIARGPSDQAAAFADGDATAGYCQVVNEVFDLNADGKNRFGYTFPKEGPVGWIDNIAITPRGQREASYRFINEMLSPQWQARFITSANTNGILTTAEARNAGVSEATLRQTTIAEQDDPSFWRRLSVFSAPEDIERRIQLWNDFKAGML